MATMIMKLIKTQIVREHNKIPIIHKIHPANVQIWMLDHAMEK
jgi:hypothetical protein